MPLLSTIEIGHVFMAQFEEMWHGLPHLKQMIWVEKVVGFLPLPPANPVAVVL